MTELIDEPGAILDCGWGRLIFGHTFPDPESVAETVLQEEPGRRDIAFYLNDPQIVLNHSPQELFLDPSSTFRLHKANYEPAKKPKPGIVVGELTSEADLEEVNRIYSALHMVPVKTDYVWARRASTRFRYWIARHEDDGRILGVAMGVDHTKCFNDIQNSSSLWALAVDPQAELPGVGESLTRHLAEYFFRNGRDMMDLSVMHNNKGAIRLYEKLGFEKVAVFAIKRRNSINEKLFVGAPPEKGFNPYAQIIIQEALRRSISVDPIDPERGYFKLSTGGRVVTCRESLTDMTSAIAMSRCSDKQLTSDLLRDAGLCVPAQMVAGKAGENERFLQRHGSVVVKPAMGEQGHGISVDVRTPEELATAVEEARKWDETVLLEQFAEGEDLRIIVINGEAVAAAVRRPAEIVGTGQHTVKELIESLSRRRAAATGGESRIPLDAETERCVRANGYAMTDKLPEGEHLRVRKTANLHTGGTIHDVTERLHPSLREAAIQAAATIEIPVAGLDLIVPSVEGPGYVFIEINERPGLANHEPQPTAERFIDFLFPQTVLPPKPIRRKA